MIQISNFVSVLEEYLKKNGVTNPNGIMIAGFLVLSLVGILALYYSFCFVAWCVHLIQEVFATARERRRQAIRLRIEKKKAVLAMKLQKELSTREHNSLKAAQEQARQEITNLSKKIYDYEKIIKERDVVSNAQIAKENELNQQIISLRRRNDELEKYRLDYAASSQQFLNLKSEVEQQNQMIREQNERLQKSEAEQKRLSNQQHAMPQVDFELQKRCDALVEERSQLQEKFDKFRADNETIKTQVETAKARARELEAKLQEALRGEVAAAELRTRIEEIERDLIHAQSEKESLNSQMALLRKKEETAITELILVHKELEDARAAVRRSQEGQAGIEQEREKVIEQLQKERLNFQKDLARVQSEKESVAGESNLLRKKEETAAAALVNLRKELEDARAMAQSSKESHAAIVQEKNAVFERFQKEAQDRFNKTQEALFEQRQQVKEIKQQNAKLEEALKEQRIHLEDLETKQAQEHVLYTEVRAELAKTKGFIEESEAAIRKAEHRNKEMMDELSDLKQIKKEKESLQEKGAALEKQCQAAMKEVENLKKAGEQQTKDLEELSEQKEKLETLNSTAAAKEVLMEKEMDETFTQSSSLEQRLEELELAHRQLEQKAKEAQENNTQLEQDVLKLKAALDQERKKGTEVEKEKVALEKELAAVLQKMTTKGSSTSAEYSELEISEDSPPKSKALENEAFCAWVRRFGGNSKVARIWITRDEFDCIQEDINRKSTYIGKYCQKPVSQEKPDEIKKT